MKILNKEITKKQVKVFIGAVLGTAAVATVVGLVKHDKEQNLIEGIEYVEIEEIEIPTIELDSYKEEA